MKATVSPARYDVIDVDQAAAALRAVAATGPLTSTIGSFTTEWPLDEAVEFISECEAVAWAPGPNGDNLAARRPDGTIVRFHVPAPTEVAA